MAQDEEITIESKICPVFDKNPKIIAEETEKRIQELVDKEIIANTIAYVLVSERKGINLFRPYLTRVENLKSISSIKLHSYSNVIRENFEKPLPIQSTL